MAVAGTCGVRLCAFEERSKVGSSATDRLGQLMRVINLKRTVALAVRVPKSAADGRIGAQNAPQFRQKCSQLFVFNGAARIDTDIHLDRLALELLQVNAPPCKAPVEALEVIWRTH